MEKVIVCDLGYIEYAKAWEIQKALVAKKANDSGFPDYLLLVEHPHVITLGRKGNTENVLEWSLPVYHIERGGDVTYHGPGQLVAYPIIDLTKRTLTLKGYVRMLEELVIQALNQFDIQAQRIEGQTGVWVSGKKVASIGVAVDHWITFHGLALNVNTDLSYFYKIRPCGYSPSVMTSLEVLLGKKVDMERVKHALLQAFSKVFDAELSSIGLQELTELLQKGVTLKNE
jgi:lipoate-protein ligase B